MKLLQSRKTLAIEIQIYMSMSEPTPAIFVVVADIVIFLYKKRKTVVVNPFKIHEIPEMVCAENVPSACTIQVSEHVEGRIGRSHLIFESNSMGLLMRYIFEQEYEIELDFCDSVPIRISGAQRDFCFTELEAIKQDLASEDNNGTVRCTVNSPLHVCEEGGLFVSDVWEPIYGVMTNLGLFRYDRVRPMETLPKIMRLHLLELFEVKGPYKGRKNVFRLKYINDKEKVSEKYFSVDDGELYQKWLSKIRLTIKDYAELGNKILQPPSARLT